MAKTAAALHILVKEEKLALDLLEQLKNGARFRQAGKETLHLSVRQTRWRSG
ncbi:peptidyl-prolyl cis-trans isomerase ppiC [Klebsiella pneumoniae subsp. ozaenae]|uniref:Peptidyl-prolyl cis-trans isomerase ppiC n=1 Tax=Klebsiella pneumoniae subsp. ozaenae TaxID=574 RepID=A0A378B8S0_KLEPO|nr:peptidyl-prolyl cis-trans isomerase ppiC [Klebsiella pneumoniae subsp. ozaenae]